MKYLKFFESYRGTVSVNRDLFIKVLSDYSSTYDDGLVTQLEELGFESSDVIADMIEDSLNNGDRISLEAIALLVDEISRGNSERSASKLQDIYNECEEKGIIKGDFDLVLYNHQSPLNCFTRNITKERFYQLREEANKYVDKYNSKAKFRRVFASLSNLGFRATWKRIYRHFYSKYLNYTIVKSS